MLETENIADRPATVISNKQARVIISLKTLERSRKGGTLRYERCSEFSHDWEKAVDVDLLCDTNRPLLGALGWLGPRGGRGHKCRD